MTAGLKNENRGHKFKQTRIYIYIYIYIYRGWSWSSVDIESTALVYSQFLAASIIRPIALARNKQTPSAVFLCICYPNLCMYIYICHYCLNVTVSIDMHTYIRLNVYHVCLPKLCLYTHTGCPRGVMVKAMDCGIVLSEFVLQSR